MFFTGSLQWFSISKSRVYIYTYLVYPVRFSPHISLAWFSEYLILTSKTYKNSPSTKPPSCNFTQPSDKVDGQENKCAA